MLTKKASVLLAIAFVLAVAWVPIAHPQAARTAATWEYAEMQLSASAPSAPLMNRMGAEGWELVNVVAACDSITGRCAWWAYFKRRT